MLKWRKSEIILVVTALCMTAAIVIFAVIDSSKPIAAVSYDIAATSNYDSLYVDEAEAKTNSTDKTAVGGSTANNTAKTAKATTKKAVVNATRATKTEAFNGVININTASAEELTVLNGIGEKIAGRIVDYRNENGKFSSIDEIMNVSGIGEKKFEKIKEHITVG